MHVLRDHWGSSGISQVDAAALQEAVDREPFQQVEAIASRSQSPTSATKSANRNQRTCSKQRKKKKERPPTAAVSPKSSQRRFEMKEAASVGGLLKKRKARCL